MGVESERMGNSPAVDIEDGTDEPPPPPGFWQKKYCAIVLGLLVVCSVMFTSKKFGAFVGNEPNMRGRHLKFTGDSRFKVTDAGHEDKMRLMLHVHSGKRYSLLETSARTIRRDILVMNTMLPSAPMEQRLRIGLTFYSQNADIYGLIDDETSSEEEADEEVVKLSFVCTEFSILNREDSQRVVMSDDGRPMISDEAGEWKAPSVWHRMAEATIGKEFLVKLAYNGSVVDMETQSIHQAVVEKLHEINALPMEMVYKLQLYSPSSGDGDKVFDSLGAQWNPPGTKTVHGPLRLMNGTLCDVPDIPADKTGLVGVLNGTSDQSSWLAVVPRGECTFVVKAKNAQLMGASGMVVINDEEELVLMAGTAIKGLTLPSVMISKSDGMEVEADWIAGKYTQSAILAGHDAVGRHDHAGDGTESDEFMLPDFMGYDSMIEEEVNRFFSIFPETAVGIGDTWQRSIELQRPDESERSTQTEQYTLLEMPPLPPNCAAVFGSDHGLCGSNRHGVARIAVQSWSDSKPAGGSLSVNFHPDSGAEVGSTKVVEHGEFIVDTYSGLIQSGFLEQSLEGLADFPKMGAGAVLKTKLTALSNFSGGIPVSRGGLPCPLSNSISRA